MIEVLKEQSEIGGVPYGVSLLAQILPSDKQKRTQHFRIHTVILTYATWTVFSALTEPMPAIMDKIGNECNKRAFNLSMVNGTFELNMVNITDFRKWCGGSFFERNAGYMMANLLSFFYFILGISTLFSGVIADSFNPRYFLSAGCILSGFFAIALGLAARWNIYTYEYFTVIIVLFAICQSMIWPICLTCITHWYFGTRRGFFFGIWNTNTYLGNLMGFVITHQFINQSWCWSFYLLGLMVILVGFLNLCLLIIHPSELDNLDKSTKSIRDTEVELELPPWLDSNYGIKFMEALKVPGVIEFSACSFFSRLSSFLLSSQLPGHENDDDISFTRSQDVLFTLTYMVGAFIGNAVVGITKDAFKRNSLICIFFLIVSILVIFLQQASFMVDSKVLEAVLYILLGLFVEAPFIFLSTSVSADLGTHSRIRRGVRGLSTVAAIVEASGAFGSCIVPIVNTYLISRHWHYFVILVTAQSLGALCLLRMVIREFRISFSNSSFPEEWRKNSAIPSCRL